MVVEIRESPTSVLARMGRLPSVTAAPFAVNVFCVRGVNLARHKDSGLTVSFSHLFARYMRGTVMVLGIGERARSTGRSGKSAEGELHNHYHFVAAQKE